MKDYKPEHNYKIITELYNTKEMKVFVKLHLKYIKEGDETLGVIEKYVTGLEYSPSKTFYYKDDMPAHDFKDVGNALDFCVAVGVNGYTASVVLVPYFADEKIYYNYKEKKDAH